MIIRKRRRLARPVGPDEPVERARGDRQVQAVDRDDVAEALGDIPDRDGGIHEISTWRFRRIDLEFPTDKHASQASDRQGFADRPDEYSPRLADCMRTTRSSIAHMRTATPWSSGRSHSRFRPRPRPGLP